MSLRQRVQIPILVIAGSIAACTSGEDGTSPSPTPVGSGPNATATVPGPTVTPAVATPTPSAAPATTEPPSSPSPAPTPTSRATSTPAGDPAEPVYLAGPYGILDGVVGTESAWPDAASLRQLDPVFEMAPLTLDFRDLDAEFESWSVSVAPADDPSEATALLLARGPVSGEPTDVALVDGPEAGDWIVRAAVTPVDQRAAVYDWLMHVPNRRLPPDGIAVPDLPGLVVSAGSSGAIATAGSSCYVSVCADPGGMPRAADLEVAMPEHGTELSIRLLDSSGFIAWNVSATPADDRTMEPMPLASGADPAGTTEARFAAPMGGDWILTIAVTFDLERGAATYYARSIEAPTQH